MTVAIVEETRAIVEADERYDGKIIPIEQAEIARPVTVREGGTVTGAVYGENITVERRHSSRDRSWQATA